MRAISWRHFQPINTWTPCAEQKGSSDPTCIMDMSTREAYSYISKKELRKDFFSMIVKTPRDHVSFVAQRVFRLITFYHYHSKIRTPPWRQRVRMAKDDVLDILKPPLSLIFFEIAAIYALISPNNGRKLFASIDRVFYSPPIISLCPEKHRVLSTRAS